MGSGRPNNSQEPPWVLDISQESPAFINWAATRRGDSTHQDPQSFKKFIQKLFRAKSFQI